MLAISTARADITPTAMAEMGGYATLTGPRLATGTYSPLWARVLILWDPDPHAIITLDAGTLPPAWHQALRPRLVGLADWASADISILCTHTHNAPMTLSHPDPWITYAATDLGPCEAYWDDLADTVLDLVSDALNGWKTPATIDYRSVTQGWSDSRTQPKTYKETAVPVLAFRDLSGQPVAVLFGFGTHAVTAGQQTKWDGDYPSAACAVIEAGIPGGVHAQFIPGSGGDQNPTSMGTWGIRNMLGARLGSAVVEAVNTPGRPLVAPITTSLTSVAVPLKVPANATERAARRAEYVARYTVNAALYDAVPYYRRHAPIAIGQIDAGTDAHTINVPIQVWRLGVPTLRILFLGGEPVSGYGLWARNNYGGTNGILIGGYANEVPCYVVGDPQFPPTDLNGGYEAGENTLDRDCAGESMCVYGWPWHFKPGLTAGCAEPTILAALTAALA